MIWRGARTRVYGTLFGRDDSPAAFRLHAPVGDIAMMLGIPHGIAMRHLIAAVFRDLWANFDRREKYIVTLIARHMSARPDLRFI